MGYIFNETLYIIGNLNEKKVFVSPDSLFYFFFKQVKGEDGGILFTVGYAVCFKIIFPKYLIDFDHRCYTMCSCNFS